MMTYEFRSVALATLSDGTEAWEFSIERGGKQLHSNDFALIHMSDVVKLLNAEIAPLRRRVAQLERGREYLIEQLVSETMAGNAEWGISKSLKRVRASIIEDVEYEESSDGKG